MNDFNREEHFKGDSNTLMYTHVWGTGCNLECSFCLNEGFKNLNNNKEINFKITNIFANLSQNTNKKLLFVEHGGELLYCKYLDELFEYKIKKIKNYRALFFTNGTNFNKYKKFIDKYYKNVEPFLSFHVPGLSDKLLHEFDKSIKYNIIRFGYCNIAFVYYEKLDYNLFVNMFESHIHKYKDKVKIKVFFDKDMLGKHDKRLLISSAKFMSYLDNNKYSYKRLLSDYYHKSFSAKSTFCLNEKQRENIPGKFMGAVEVVDRKVQYISFLNELYTCEFNDIQKINEKLLSESINIKTEDIDISDKEVIYQLVEIL